MGPRLCRDDDRCPCARQRTRLIEPEGLRPSDISKQEGQHPTSAVAAGVLRRCSPIRTPMTTRPAMQSYVAPSDSSLAPSIAIHDGHAVQFAEVDDASSRTPERPESSHRAALPKRPLRERLRRPLLILFPVLLAVFGGAYYAGRRALRLHRRCLRPRGEGIDQRPRLPARWSKSPSRTISVSNRASSCSRSIRNHTRSPSTRPRRGSPARGCRSRSSRPPIASKWPSSNRRRIPCAYDELEYARRKALVARRLDTARGL